MAGTPIKAEKLAALDANEAAIFEYLEDGRTLEFIAGAFGVGRRVLMRWLNRDEKRTERYARARARAADAVADSVRTKTAALADRAATVGVDAAEVAAHKLHAEVERWTAGIWDRERYGEAKQGAVTVNLNVLHLDALRQAPAVPVASARPAEALPDVIDVEARDATPLRLEDLL